MTTVLFTGAGASRAIGYPLTSELLPRIRTELKSGDLFADTNGKAKDRADRGELEGFLKALLPGIDSAPDRQLPLITELFSLVEHAIASNEALPIGGEDRLRRCRDLLKQAIADILVGDFSVSYDRSDPGQRGEEGVLKELVRWVEAQGRGLAIVTTNYDTGLEYELYERRGQRQVYKTIDLGFDWRHIGTGEVHTRPPDPQLRVYKLHGSLDVLRCPLCGHAYFNPWGAIALQVFRNITDANNTCHCLTGARLDLHIVSPSMVREMREVNLLSVWRNALECMRRAAHWIIVGYSLPPEDLAVRSLLMRAYATASPRPRVTVVQQGDAARSRYELLFPACRYEGGGLEAFLGEGPRRSPPTVK